ncbi:MAG: glycine--tRNA ligase subunit beta [Sphingobium sp.]|uniref:glycine--tRNA ligase subunit beta n=1 Tax=Sphingobium sp. TaxID=1912891 RepID=UPI0029A36B37|nr:glycine--tRNA ligase subunit beta [Sphingobium sp.]MDX3908774.1 glycine--tRNA ligase subunit beta [Sphingobium sp.]
MTDFLLELRCEEIPARMQQKASEDLARLFTEKLAEAGLKAEGIESFVTPRRLALIARGLPLRTEAVNEELKGPRADAPPQALAGFLGKTGLTREQLVERPDAKGNVILFAVIEKPGRATSDVLAEAVPAIVRAFPWPKSMRWGSASQTTESLRWVRPLQGIVAILGEELVDMEIEGVRSGFATLGHRFHHPDQITIGGANDYVEKLRACHVVVDHAERMGIIEAKAQDAAAARGLTLVVDRGLVAENAGLTEWPVPLLGDFDPAFLEVPPEVIQLTLRTNQKYFVLRNAAGNLASVFICTANIEAHDGGAAIIAGNRKVLAARLSDARFFWEQDKKTPLAEHARKLERITFHEKLGTVADKVERVAKLAEWLATEGIVPHCDPALARQAAELCKADLVTEMVGEFPELQGIMGGYYARAEGLPDAVADAIRDHYKPVGQGDEVPTAPVTVAVSLADKLDTLSRFFLIDERPTGSKDPFALRRAALGLIALIITNSVRISIYDLFHASEPLSKGSPDMGAILAADHFNDFIIDRIKVQQRDFGVRHDVIDAVVFLGGDDDIGGERDLVRLLGRVKALQLFVETADGTNLLAGYKRATNILKKEAQPPIAYDVRNGYAPEPAETALIAALDAAEPRAAEAIANEDFAAAMAALATLRAPIDAFFDNVTVNDPDPEKRSARLALLARMRDAVHGVADFSRIEG